MEIPKKLPCGHFMHDICLQRLVMNHDQCSICKKLILPKDWKKQNADDQFDENFDFPENDQNQEFDLQRNVQPEQHQNEHEQFQNEEVQQAQVQNEEFQQAPVQNKQAQQTQIQNEQLPRLNVPHPPKYQPRIREFDFNSFFPEN